MRTALLLILAAALLPATAHAATWTGKVTFVADGDTLDVDVAGDGTRKAVRVRITGIQAMEQSVYSRNPRRRRGDCHALEATARLERLVRRARGRVRLTARDPRSHSKHRARRSVAVRIHGAWRDVGSILVREGHALWLPNQVESAWNATYSALSRQAGAAGRGVFDSDACGAGPHADLGLTVNWDAEGNDGRNVNGEWIRVINRDTRAAASLAGWWVRDSDLRRYAFPAGTTMPPGGSIRVHVGHGQPAGAEHFWGLPDPAFENEGDGAYLFDPHGDLRAWEIYG